MILDSNQGIFIEIKTKHEDENKDIFDCKMSSKMYIFSKY